MTEPSRSRAADQRYYGVAEAIVEDNADPEGQGRVRLRLPWLSGEMVTEWCRVTQPYAGGGYGAYFVPEVGDEVLVSFIHGDLRFPIILGGLYNGVDQPPFSRNGEDPKYLQTKAGHRLLMEDGAGARKIEIIDADGQNSIVIDTEAGTITISASMDITIEAAASLTLRGSSGVTIQSDANVEINAGGSASLGAAGEVSVAGATINLN